MRNNEEFKIQCGFVNWARFSQIRFPELKLLYAIPNGGHRTKIAGAKIKAEGGLAGVPDLHLPIGRKGFNSLYIETKTKKGKMSPAQRKIKELLEQEHNAHVVCRCISEFMEIVESYLLTDKDFKSKLEFYSS